MQTSARADGDAFVVNGTKMFVENFGSSHHCLVTVRTAPATKESAGLSLLLIDTTAAGISETALVTLAKDKMSAITFKDVRVPKANLVPKPAALSFEEAACLPTAYLTAYKMLFDKSGAQPGSTILVQGASGGVASTPSRSTKRLVKLPSVR
ncbi:MAG: acyl-CoA dehydrogenase family protein, partial [Enhydrobacter sp.]